MLRAPRITCGSNLQDCGPLVRNQVQRKGHLIRIRTSFCTFQHTFAPFFFDTLGAGMGVEEVLFVVVQKGAVVRGVVEQLVTVD